MLPSVKLKYTCESVYFRLICHMLGNSLFPPAENFEVSKKILPKKEGFEIWCASKFANVESEFAISFSQRN